MGEVRALHAGRGRRWDEASIRAALGELLADREEWPTCEEFASMGAKHLRELIGRGRGAAWWAGEMGLPGGDRSSGGVRRWSEERIRATLRGFLGSRTTWPSWPEFEAAGLRAFREALCHYGGPERWAAEMGVALPPARRPSRVPRPRPKPPVSDWPLWTDERIAGELAQFLHGRTDWPRHAEFVAAGRKRLYAAVLTHGGSRRWAERMGVQRVERQRGSARHEPNERSQSRSRSRAARRARWDDEQIEAAIGPLVRELGRWPTKSEFHRAGLRPALAAVYDHGGSEQWRHRLGVGATPFSGPLPDRRRWDEERIEAELRRFCRRRRRWPTYSEFRAAGLPALYAAVCRYGGRDYWSERLGLK
ncbi:MAG: hypothetical protein ACRDLP_16235 [Solirubrobacteraceae bacterium]